MNVIRSGPKQIILQCEDCHKTYDALGKNYKINMHLSKSKDMYDKYLCMIGLLDDRSTVVALTKNMASKLSFKYEDFEYLLVLDMAMTDVLIDLVMIKESLQIKSLRQSTEMVIMRTTGDGDKYIKTVLKDIDGELIDTEKMHESYGVGTLIVFTEKKINGPLGNEDFKSHAIFTRKKEDEVIKYLSNRRYKYINASIDNKDWHELTIKIYDSYEQYDLHYKRLTLMLEALDCGLILGEAWGSDAALAFLSVEVYRIRLFTYLEPLAIKKIVFGLEYDDFGQRVVDFDLFKKRKKYYWTDVRLEKKIDRDAQGCFYRKEVLKDVHEETLFELRALEKKIKK